MGIDENTPVVVGASDGVLSNLGVNSYKKVKLQSQLGHQVRFVQSLINLSDYKGRIFCYVLDEEHYVIGGPVNNGVSFFDGYEMNYSPVKLKQQNAWEWILTMY